MFLKTLVSRGLEEVAVLGEDGEEELEALFVPPGVNEVFGEPPDEAGHRDVGDDECLQLDGCEEEGSAPHVARFVSVKKKVWRECERRRKEKGLMGSEGEWTSGGELLLKAWVEKGSCMNWMHGWASDGASRTNTMLTMPVIMLTSATTMIGTSAASSAGGASEPAMLAITVMSLASAMAGAAAKVLKTAERAEEHRAAALAWGRYLRRFKMQLSLYAEERAPMRETLEKAKSEYDSLMEQFPFVPPYVVRDFERRHKAYKGARPDLTSGPEEVLVAGMSDAEEQQSVDPEPTEEEGVEVAVELA